MPFVPRRKESPHKVLVRTERRMVGDQTNMFSWLTHQRSMSFWPFVVHPGAMYLPCKGIYVRFSGLERDVTCFQTEKMVAVRVWLEVLTDTTVSQKTGVCDPFEILTLTWEVLGLNTNKRLWCLPKRHHVVLWCVDCEHQNMTHRAQAFVCWWEALKGSISEVMTSAFQR